MIIMNLEYARKQTGPKRRGYLLVAIMIIILVLFGLSPIMKGFSRSSTVYTEIDINSGRIRQVRHLFRFDLDEKVQRTVVSKALPPGKQLPAEWIQISPGDCFSGHAAYCEVQELGDLYRTSQFTANAKRVIAANMVRIWRTRRYTTSLDRYIEALGQVADVVNRDTPRAVDVADLPRDPRPPLKVYGQHWRTPRVNRR